MRARTRRFGGRGLGTSALVLAAALSACGAGTDPPGPADAAVLAWLPWDSVLVLARGTDVTWRMWRGDPAINAYVDGWVAPRLEDRLGVRLTAVNGQGPELVNQLALERDAGARGGADLVWINGETFQNMRDEDLLQGPWAGALPSARYLDSTSAIVMRDFEQPLEGFESPWGRVQFALIYDTLRTPDPPRTVDELGDWISSHPGRFTHDQAFTGITFHKILMYALSGGVEQFQGGFREGDYAAGRDALLEWLGAHRDAFWRGGTVYPADVADLHRLFANGEGEGAAGRPAFLCATPSSPRRDHRERPLRGHSVQRAQPGGCHGGGRLPSVPRGAAREAACRCVGGRHRAVGPTPYGRVASGFPGARRRRRCVARRLPAPLRRPGGRGGIPRALDRGLALQGPARRRLRRCEA